MKRLALLILFASVLPGCGGGVNTETYVPDKDQLDEPMPDTSEEAFESAPPELPKD